MFLGITGCLSTAGYNWVSVCTLYKFGYNWVSGYTEYNWVSTVFLFILGIFGYQMVVLFILCKGGGAGIFTWPLYYTQVTTEYTGVPRGNG